MRTTRGSKATVAAISALAIAILIVGTTTASAGAATTTTTPAGPPTSVGIGGNYGFSSAKITGPGMAKPRTLNAYQSSVFVQSWLVDAFYGKHAQSGPPPGLPVYRVDVTGNWGGSYTTLTVYYAANKNTVWIAWPRQPIDTTPTSQPPKPSGWFVALPRVRQAFAGTAKLLQTGGVIAESPSTTPGASPSTTTTVATTDASSGSSGSSAFLWIVLGAAVLAAALVAATRIRGRSARAPSRGR
jgi:hypothetical protein